MMWVGSKHNSVAVDIKGWLAIENQQTTLGPRRNACNPARFPRKGGMGSVRKSWVWEDIKVCGGQGFWGKKTYTYSTYTHIHTNIHIHTHITHTHIRIHIMTICKPKSKSGETYLQFLLFTKASSSKKFPVSSVLCIPLSLLALG